MKKEQATYHGIFDTEIFEGELNLHKYPWHFHEAYTVVMVDEGAMEYFFRNGDVCVHTGNIFIVNPFVAHYNKALNDESCRYKAMFLPIWLFNPSRSGNSIVYLEKVPNDGLYQELGQLFEKLKNVSEGADYLIVINQVKELLFSNFTHKVESLPVIARVKPALQFIHQHLDEKLTIAQLAAACNLSHYHFQRIFKNSVGLTVNAYLQQCRMERGRALLRSGTSPVTTSLESGFFDQSHFYKQFKKMWVLTPAYLTK
ncbi:MAG: AraC family transcriptional regulator [Bacteroidota bacterium]